MECRVLKKQLTRCIFMNAKNSPHCVAYCACAKFKKGIIFCSLLKFELNSEKYLNTSPLEDIIRLLRLDFPTKLQAFS